MSLLSHLPPPPPGKTGWPWTVESDPVPPVMPSGCPWPKISIVTPSYNQGKFIEETIRSVLLQNYPNLEYIIIDGGSTDNSVDIIKKYEPWLTYWMSEKDRGQSHAINKGVRRISGDIFNWINSDDFLDKSSLVHVAINCPSNGILGAAVREFGDNWEKISSNSNLSFVDLVRSKKESVFLQPGFWMASSLIKYGFPLKENLHYAFDWYMALNILAKTSCISYKSMTVANFRHHDQSKTVQQSCEWTDDGIKILNLCLENNELKKYHDDCKKALNKILWHREIEVIRKASRCPAFKIMQKILNNPIARTDRYTLGAIRQSIIRKDL